MINFRADEQARILTIEMRGTISEADLDAAMAAFEARFPAVGVHVRGGEHGGVAVLVDWQDLDGWEKGAKTLGTITAKAIGDAVRRIAVVADDRFADEKPRLADVAPRAEVRFFAPGEQDAAVAWLKRG